MAARSMVGAEARATPKRPDIPFTGLGFGLKDILERGRGPEAGDALGGRSGQGADKVRVVLLPPAPQAE